MINLNKRTKAALIVKSESMNQIHPSSTVVVTSVILIGAVASTTDIL